MKSNNNILNLEVAWLLLLGSTIAFAQDTISVPFIQKVGIKVVMKADIDLSNESIHYEYSFRNETNDKTQFRVLNPHFIQDVKELLISPKKTKKIDFSGRVEPVALTQNTRFITSRLYLLVKEAEQTEKMLWSDYDVNIQIKLPSQARILRSSIQVTNQKGNKVLWNMKGLKILPVIMLWYTTAPEKVSIKKVSTLLDGGTIRLALEVLNQSGMNIKNLTLNSQFPISLFEPVPEQSDGKFEVVDNIMVGWNDSIEKMSSGSSKKINLILKTKQAKNNDLPEIRIYNSIGDLIGIE